MAKSSKKNLGLVLIQISLAVIFVLAGLSLLGVKQLGSSEAASIRSALAVIGITGITAQIIGVVIGVLVLLCGAILILRFFWNPGNLDNVLKAIALIVWIVVTVLLDIICGFALLPLAKDLLIIGGILAIHD